MTDRTELRHLLDEHLKAMGYHDVTETWFRVARAAVNNLEPLLNRLDAAEADLNDAILYWKDTRDALARQTPHYLAAKAGVERVRELHAPYYPLRDGHAYCRACEGDEFVAHPCATINALDNSDT